MLQKKSFKVLAAIPKRDGGTYWMRCGNGYTNKDDSINVYLDAIPKEMKFQLREFDEEDLRRREASRSLQGAGAPPPPPPPGDTDSPPF